MRSSRAGQELTANIIFLLAVVCGLLYPYDSAAQSGPIAYWPMLEGQGTSTQDVAGGNTATLVNGPLWSADAGIEFDGNDDHLSVDNLNVTGTGLTLMARFRAHNLSNCDSRDCRIVSKAMGTASADHYFMVSTIKKSGLIRLRFRLKTDGATSTLIASSGDISENQWVHVAAVYDGAEMRLYKDGVLVGTKAKTGSITTNANAPVWIGGNPPVATSRPWDGEIDEVRIYDRALTVEEIQALVSAPNQAPQAVDDPAAAATPENTPVNTINVLANDVLVDNAVISTFDSTSVNNGTVVNNGDGTFLYSPASGFSGSDSFTYTLLDDDQQSDTATVTVQVITGNGAPVAVDDPDAATTPENTPVTTDNVLSNDTLVDNAVISSFDAVSVEGGTVVHNGDGTFHYTPAMGFTGGDSFTYTLEDEDQESSSATVGVSVLPSASGLVAYWPMSEGQGTTTADTSVNNYTGTLNNGAQWGADGGIDFDGIDDYVDVGTFDVAASVISLTASFRADNLANCTSVDCRIISKASSTSTQDHYFMVSTIKKSGLIRLRFRLKTNGATSTLIASSGDIPENQWVHVAAVYDGAEMRLYKDGVLVGTKAKTGSITTNANAPVWIGGNPPVATSRPWDGEIDEVRIYDRALTVEEIQALVSAPSQAPQAVDDPAAAATPENTPVNTINVLANDVLVDNAVISTFDSTSVNNGTVVNNGDGTFLYSPASGFSGSDSFTYTLLDDDQQSDTATVTVQVITGNGAPLAVDDPDAATTPENTPVTTDNVLSNDTLVDNAVISSFDVSGTNGGAISYNNNGTFNYSPALDFHGSDSFTYTLTDDDNESSTATATVTVTPVDSGVPVAADDPDGATTLEDNAVTTVNVLANDTLTDNAFISTYDAISVQGGALSSNGDGTFLYTPPSGFNGADSFTYTLADDDADTATATVGLQVTAVNNGAPVAVDDPNAASTSADTAVDTVNVLNNDTLVDNAVISSFDAVSVEGGTVVHNGDGTFHYTPATGFTGGDSFTYTLEDEDQESSSATVGVSVLSSASGLVAYWPMSEGQGTTTADASANNYTGTLNNGAQWGADGGIDFDGIDDYVDVGTFDVAASVISLTASFRADNLANCTSVDCRIISKASSASTQDHYFMVSTIKKSGLIRLRFRLKTNGATSTLIASSGDIPENQWVHVAAVYDGAEMRLYKDGVLVGTKAKTGSITGNGSTPIWIGGNPLDATSRPWDGQIDEVRFYNRTLSLSEIQQLAAGTGNGPIANDDNDAAITEVNVPVNTINVLLNDQLVDNAVISAFDSVSVNNGIVTDNGDGTFFYTPATDFWGLDSFTYTLTDDQQQTDTATVSLQVTPPNRPPEVVQLIPDQQATEASQFGPLDTSGSFNDPDGDTLSYGLSGLPADTGLVIDPNTGVITGIPTNADAQAPQPTIVEVLVDDGRGGMVSTSFNLAVTNINQPPQVLNPIGDQTANESVPFGPLDTSVHFYDPDNDSLNYVITGLPVGTGLSIDPVTGIISGAPNSNDSQASQPINVSVTVDDGQGGSTATGINISVSFNDTPSLSISSHASGASVSESGFLLSGASSDSDGIASVVASVNDPVLGLTVDQKTLDRAPASGNWDFPVFNGQVTLGETVTVTLTATDIYNKSVTETLDLLIVAKNVSAHHVANRITFGYTPALKQQIESQGTANTINEQLNPALIDDSEFETLIGGVNVVSVSDLQDYFLLHMISTKRQLQEVMTWFWDNHFSTDVNKHNKVQYELDENNLFRANAFGNFRDLLSISAKSPAMLEFLDGVTNVKGNANENYARELMELHTLGVNGGYTETDVEEVARAFTGWTIQNDQFFFDSSQHDETPMTVLGQTIAVGGIGDGEMVLDIMASHASTATFICEKLITLLVADIPANALVSNCASTFQNSTAAPDQIKQVLNVILTSPEFNDSSNYLDKVKSPVEFVIGALRQLEATAPFDDVPDILHDLGLPLFENHIPTGYPEAGIDWINTDQLRERFKFVNQLSLADRGGDDGTIDPLSFFTQQGYETADGIIWYLFSLTLGPEFTTLEWNTARDVLTDDGTTVFDIQSSDADSKLRKLIGTVLSYPSYQEQ